MTTPSRKLPISLSRDGKLTASAKLSSVKIKIPGEVRIPPQKVMPVIVVPGIMGSNLCASAAAASFKNPELKKTGEQAWRPPNGPLDGLSEADKWDERKAAQRQWILHGPSLMVDEAGDIDIPLGYGLLITEKEARKRGWGGIHWDSYGLLLAELQLNLNRIVYSDSVGRCHLFPRWRHIQHNDGKSRLVGNQRVEPLTHEELHKAAEYHFPVYAHGYNWLLSNKEAASSLAARIEKIFAYWRSRGNACDRVILVTHSMGGLVARACAKRHPSYIAGIVHGVMPALGAPVCFRRIAFGTECTTPGDRNWVDDIAADKFAEIAGRTAAETTPVLATAAGPLELLPNQLFPQPWLLFRAQWQDDPIREILRFPQGNPYDFYKDTKSWYRMIDPGLADPAGIFGGRERVNTRIWRALKQAEQFHAHLSDYYHPNTFAFYGNDRTQWSFGSCQWICKNVHPARTPAEIANGRVNYTSNNVGTRSVWLDKHNLAVFLPLAQDTSGDGTVPGVSGRAPEGKVKLLLETQGYDHQGSYKDRTMLDLTQQLIIKLVQGVQ